MFSSHLDLNNTYNIKDVKANLKYSIVYSQSYTESRIY